MMNFIHCNDEKVFKTLVENGFAPLKNDYPYVLLNDENIKFEFSSFNDAIEFSDIMYF